MAYNFNKDLKESAIHVNTVLTDLQSHNALITDCKTTVGKCSHDATFNFNGNKFKLEVKNSEYKENKICIEYATAKNCCSYLVFPIPYNEDDSVFIHHLSGIFAEGVDAPELFAYCSYLNNVKYIFYFNILTLKQWVLNNWGKANKFCTAECNTKSIIFMLEDLINDKQSGYLAKQLYNQMEGN